MIKLEKMHTQLLKSTLLFFVSLSTLLNLYGQSPNILLVIADDLGVDYSNGYHDGNLMPTTPTLDSLRATGITFENAFAAPKCTPTRAAIMSGKYGVKTGVLGTPGHLDTAHTSIFKAVESETNGQYADAVIGKWHLAAPEDPYHPEQHGIDYYMGFLGPGPSDYYAWDRTENGQTTIDSSYVTSAFTDASINWINAQSHPWFLWLAHAAPHSPHHIPPDSLYTIGNTGNPRRKFIAMIEAMDHEIGRLLDNIPTNELQNTIVVFVGDNGTSGSVLQDYPAGHGKGTLYQGGVRVPMIVSGAGVSRQGERESALIQVADIYATILEITGADLPGGIYNSLSFDHLLTNAPGSTRDYNYTEVNEDGWRGFTIRDTRYKLIESTSDTTQEFYDLLLDSLETIDLMLGGLTASQQAIKADLELEADQIRSAWSCRDHIQNGDEEGIDCGGTYCTPCSTSSNDLTIDENAIEVYPNPTENEIHLTLPQGNYTISIRDITGALIQTKELRGSQFLLELKALPGGLYFLELLNTDSQAFSVKKIVRR